MNKYKTEEGLFLKTVKCLCELHVTLHRKQKKGRISSLPPLIPFLFYSRLYVLL